MAEAHFELLRQLLTKLSDGQVPLDKRPELVELLEDCWDMFSGSDQESMEAYKLERMDEPWWDPPLLKFIIERHGGTVLGSTRAERQCWNVDLDRRIAECNVIGYRQLHPKQAPVDVKPIAEELVKLIINGSQDDHLQWSKDCRVRILTERIFPPYSAPKRTLEGRRNRLSNAISGRLTQHGWQPRGSWWEHKKE